MGEIKKPASVLLFLAIFASEESAFEWTKQKAESEFGPIELESEAFRFDEFTNYYAPSMGVVLPKRLWAFRNLIDPSELPRIKRATNGWEDEFKQIFDMKQTRQPDCGISRPLNLDPGYVDLGKFILASTKDHAHRIYLSDGIFAETTLIYTQKQWKSLPWSYPDYQSKGYQAFLDRCRNYLKETRK